MIELGKKREVFWDDYMLDTEKTTAQHRLGHPTRKDTVIDFNEPWEGDGCDFQNIINDNGLYRMYYNGWKMISKDGKRHTTEDIVECYAESRDGIHWTKPNLGIIDFKGSKDNNIFATKETLGISGIDNFYVMIDENPDKKVPGRYKAIAASWDKLEDGTYKHALHSYNSDDAIHWDNIGVLTEKGVFDSLNTVHWNTELKKYLCFVRSGHEPDFSEVRDMKKYNESIRDIRVLESEDFINWSEPKHLDYQGCEDYPLYTNVISQYYRAPQIMTGFPSRYVERHEWTKCFDRLGGSEIRWNRSQIHPRYGMAITDCLFMCSRDGYKWSRYDDCFIPPEPENGRNWVYGDSFPTVGIIETPSDIEGADNEMSMYMFENHWTGIDAQLAHYTIRKDGFASVYAGIKPEKVVTKEFSYEGNTLLLNFATSARGYLYITIRDTETGKELHSGEIFGNRTDRIIDFDGELSELAGKKVVMEIELCDGDVYAFKFDN